MNWKQIRTPNRGLPLMNGKTALPSISTQDLCLEDFLVCEVCKSAYGGLDTLAYHLLETGHVLSETRERY